MKKKVVESDKERFAKHYLQPMILTWHDRSIFRFHNFFSFLVTAVGLSEPLV